MDYMFFFKRFPSQKIILFIIILYFSLNTYRWDYFLKIFFDFYYLNLYEKLSGCTHCIEVEK